MTKLSTRNPQVVARVFSPVLLLGSTLLCSTASAGTLQVRDEEGLLSSSDRSALEAEVSSYPFDVRVLSTSAHSGDFDRYVGEQVGSPNMVVVGIDKEHRRTSVHFGMAARIAPSEFHAIEQAGTSSFRNGDLRAGIEAILNRAKESVGTAPAIERPRADAPFSAPRPSGSGFPFGWVLLGGLGLVGFIAMRRAFVGGTQIQYPPNNIPPGPGYGPGPGYPGYGGGSGLGTGILGAGLGGLAGYELGKAVGERDERDREADVLGTASPSHDEPERSNWDEGGDTGGWDDGGGGGDWGGGDDSGGSDGGW